MGVVHRRVKWMVALVVVVLAAPVAANDTAIGGSGASFGPVEETRAAMQSEHIRIRLEADGFHVHARYVLANLTDEPLALRIGFPEPVCDPEVSECMPGVRESFREMRTTVRGEEVPPVVEKTGAASRWAEEYPLIWTFAVTFAPREEVEVVHTYRVVPSANALGTLHMLYVVRTGANWGAPIGSALFEVDLPAGVCGAAVYGPEADAFRRGHREGSAHAEPLAGDALDAAQARHLMLPVRDPETGRWHARWAYRDWVPDTDFGIHVVPWEACLYRLDCPGAWGAPDPAERAREVAHLAASERPEHLRLCRNLPWAVTGYPFASHDLHDAFYGTPATAISGEAVLPHAPDPAWTERRLTPAMLDYARLLRDAERLQQP